MPTPHLHAADTDPGETGYYREPFPVTSRVQLAAARPAETSRAVSERHGQSGFFWALVYFLGSFMLQISEILSPLLFIAGLGWWLFPRLIKEIGNNLGNGDPQTQETIAHIGLSFPLHLTLGGITFSAGGLILGAVVLIGITALLNTWAVWLNRRG